ncbi:MAG: hypothetical protein V7K15_05710 [Nostoc sp.]
MLCRVLKLNGKRNRYAFGKAMSTMVTELAVPLGSKLRAASRREVRATHTQQLLSAFVNS